MKTFPAVLICIMMAASVPAQQGEVDDDTLYVSGMAVVFFGPSQTEYLTMSDLEKDRIDQDLYELYYYRKKVLGFLESNNIQEFSTVRRKIQIQLAGNQSVIYLRTDFDHALGLVLTDGWHEPRVFLGSAPDSELIWMFEEFFDLD